MSVDVASILKEVQAVWQLQGLDGQQFKFSGDSQHRDYVIRRGDLTDKLADLTAHQATVDANLQSQISDLVARLNGLGMPVTQEWVLNAIAQHPTVDTVQVESIFWDLFLNSENILAMLSSDIVEVAQVFEGRLASATIAGDGTAPTGRVFINSPESTETGLYYLNPANQLARLAHQFEVGQRITRANPFIEFTVIATAPRLRLRRSTQQLTYTAGPGLELDGRQFKVKATELLAFNEGRLDLSATVKRQLAQITDLVHQVQLINSAMEQLQHVLSVMGERLAAFGSVLADVFVDVVNGQPSDGRGRNLTPNTNAELLTIRFEHGKLYPVVEVWVLSAGREVAKLLTGIVPVANEAGAACDVGIPAVGSYRLRAIAGNAGAVNLDDIN